MIWASKRRSVNSLHLLFFVFLPVACWEYEKKVAIALVLNQTRSALPAQEDAPPGDKGTNHSQFPLHDRIAKPKIGGSIGAGFFQYHDPVLGDIMLDRFAYCAGGAGARAAPGPGAEHARRAGKLARAISQRSPARRCYKRSVKLHRTSPSAYAVLMGLIGEDAAGAEARAEITRRSRLSK
jgi:hypothetical protein